MFRSVMVGVDGGAGGRDAIALATAIAPAARLSLVHVYGQPASGSPGASRPPAFAQAAQRASSLARRSGWAVPDCAAITTRDAVPSRGLRRTVARRRPELLVLGSSHRAAVGRLLLAPDTLEDLDGLTCPLAIAPRGHAFAAARWRQIGVLDDGRAESDPAAALGRELAEAHRARLCVLPADDPVTTLAEESGQLDLLIAASGRGGRPGRVCCGGVVGALVRRSHCSLLVLPAPPVRPPQWRPVRDLHGVESHRSARVLSPI